MKIQILFTSLALITSITSGQIEVSVATDKSTYQYAESVEIFVIAHNPTSDTLTLSWPDHCQFDYLIDGEPNVDCITIPSQLVLAPDSSHTWSTVHSDPLTPGDHIIIGYVINYGEPDTTVITVESLTVDPGFAVPTQFELKPNYPNPFNPTTTVEFTMPMSELVTLRVYDVKGREVETLVDQRLDRGIYSVVWNGSSFPSGIYFIRMVSGSTTQTRKMILLK
jgi:hypothetical protein